MSKIIAMLITVSTLFLPSIIQAKPISIKVAYENNPGEPLDVVMPLLGRPIKQKK
ncbi:Hypothetical protein c5434 [Escherichia coli CFT073]|uniref:Uncharacterized protein n=1 Tax=Escherichia coli O6:H1 (strain CFT073 / ATCC 700928 / UPEC) TaxID=199310 RepID=A0A0H2VFG0_ECOL6|nr:Hypothetical protein c5434 [Escherichia coli CFT073]